MKSLLSTFVLMFCTSLCFAAGQSAMLNTNNPPTAKNQNQNQLTTMLNRVMPGVVNIYAEGEDKTESNPFTNPAPDQNRQNQDGHFISIGSGVIVDAPNGYILTNAHVIYQADNITVTLNDGRRYKGKILGYDVGFDIAVVQIDATKLTAIPLGNSNNLQVGDFVATIGSPFNLKQTVTSGIVSALHRSIHIEGNEDFIQTDAAINVGSSGGALVNMNGQLVGLNTAILAPDGGNIGIGFAIPINLAQQVMNSLLKHGKIKRALLGVLVQNLTPDLADSFGSPNAKGALISQVNKNTPADQAGLQAGDIITKVNDQPVDNSNEVRNLISLMEPDTSVSLTILRNNKPQTIRTKLLSDKELKMSMMDNDDSLLAGVSLSNFDQITLRSGHVKGARVNYVDQLSDAWASMLRPGDVIISANHQPTENIQALEAIVNKEQQHLLLHVMRDDGSFYLVIP
ncbi:MAG: Do family serine endopeptidase [Legionellales bacterium]|nr:Do family serine endopeptidase [Legionellales bacterium]